MDRNSSRDPARRSGSNSGATSGGAGVRNDWPIQRAQSQASYRSRTAADGYYGEPAASGSRRGCRGAGSVPEINVSGGNPRARTASVVVRSCRWQPASCRTSPGRGDRILDPARAARHRGSRQTGHHQAMPSMPVYFWKTRRQLQRRLLREDPRRPCHGDWITIPPAVVVRGRSDGDLADWVVRTGSEIKVEACPSGAMPGGRGRAGDGANGCRCKDGGRKSLER